MHRLSDGSVNEGHGLREVRRGDHLVAAGLGKVIVREIGIAHLGDRVADCVANALAPERLFLQQRPVQRLRARVVRAVRCGCAYRGWRFPEAS